MPDPTVSVILAVLDEAAHIDETMRSIAGQDYGRLIEVVVADGGSGDGTRERIAEWQDRDHRVVLVSNPLRRQAHGLNAAAAAAGGEYLVRADGHTAYAPDYVSRSVATAVATGAAAGGPMNPVGETRFERAVAAVMNTRWLMPARFHHASTRQEVDTVYLGTFRRSDFAAIGGFRALPSGAAEDADFYFRWRAAGMKVVVDPLIVSRYRPRGDLPGLCRQYFRYGRGKGEMLWLNGRWPSWRPLAPLALVVAIGVGTAVAVVAGNPLPIAGLLLVWLAALAVSTPSTAILPWFVTAGAAMHLAYGLGSIVALATPWVARRAAGRVAVAESPSQRPAAD